jgi:hypothetical protein
MANHTSLAHAFHKRDGANIQPNRCMCLCIIATPAFFNHSMLDKSAQTSGTSNTHLAEGPNTRLLSCFLPVGNQVTLTGYTAHLGLVGRSPRV